MDGHTPASPGGPYTLRAPLGALTGLGNKPRKTRGGDNRLPSGRGGRGGSADPASTPQGWRPHAPGCLAVTSALAAACHRSARAAAWNVQSRRAHGAKTCANVHSGAGVWRRPRATAAPPPARPGHHPGLVPRASRGVGASTPLPAPALRPPPYTTLESVDESQRNCKNWTESRPL
ncbi:hypothetical protein O3P69_011068 [Scylla paramamosain]|uniref:Uncharacterized protein n=1 Tax=Scylla paramamosain TaxID=85552 RepID=A0AAW0SUC1_SCYPA